MLPPQSIAEFTHYLPRKKKNNVNSSLKTYIYKEFVAPNYPTQADSSSSKRKMGSFVQFKITEI